jgi:misacylated tRNA(Ala) deacylase
MTDVLAQKDAYLKEFEATITAVEPGAADAARQAQAAAPPANAARQSGTPAAIALDRTAFFPGGGGQPHDLGWIADIPVIRVKRQGEWIWHWLQGAATALPPADRAGGPLAEGATVQGRIDWQRRYRLMRTHTAFHILCGVVWRDYQAQVTGGNMEELRGRMDFEFETLRGELVHEIEEKINAEVDAARPIRVRFLPREEAFRIPDLIRTKINLLPPQIQEVRIVEIEGLDLQADGGTHVANTREVGTIRISGYKSKGRINKRIELTLEP